MSDERTSYPRDWRDDERLPYYTASLDAAVELVEREMPGWTIDFYKFNAGPQKGTTRASMSALPIFKGYGEARHTLPAVALLLALLDAKGIE